MAADEVVAQQPEHEEHQADDDGHHLTQSRRGRDRDRGHHQQGPAQAQAGQHDLGLEVRRDRLQFPLLAHHQDHGVADPAQREHEQCGRLRERPGVEKVGDRPQGDGQE